MIIFNFLFNTLRNLWNALFVNITPFGFSIGTILLGVTVINFMWNLLLRFLGFVPNLNLETDKDYFFRRNNPIIRNSRKNNSNKNNPNLLPSSRNSSISSRTGSAIAIGSGSSLSLSTGTKLLLLP